MTTTDLFASAPEIARPAPAFLPTREEGLRRLRDFLPRAGAAYAAQRNFDDGPGRRNVSVLSPWLRTRLVTEEEVVHAVLARHAFEASEKFVQEVFWRTYWKGHLEMRPALWTSARDRAAALHADLAPDLASRLAAAEEGRTGIDCFDAWAVELNETGFLHNHARMWFASIWIFTLRLPWVLGADFFLRHLIDADAASNTLSWRWVAGLHTKGKHYVARPDNIASYTRGRFSPRDLARDPQPLVQTGDVAAGPLRRAEPVKPGVPSLLLLSEDDLHPESAPMPWADIRLVAGFASPSARSSRPVGTPAAAFAVEAVQGAVHRVASARGLPGEMLPAAIRDAADALVALCAREGVRQVVRGFLPVGWTADAFVALRTALGASGIHVAEILRPWDARAWPHAGRGFFPFKARIPDLCGIAAG